MANMPQLILAKDVDSKFRFITVVAVVKAARARVSRMGPTATRILGTFPDR